ncbi:hypothetical protein CVT26_011466 [Gymnopilus dilepis]|uniref:Major facilitator superfamily (MFS) profile domain-containing protein n=1 Tax=Gymnopilus dilepis TaxID=231916 RepID=A0A409VXR2_9AGAR|nr:hypothetical protein CVT26_011466 [Gymnopilus dilepis]
MSQRPSAGIEPAAHPGQIPRANIEYAIVRDDPREWSNGRKVHMVSYSRIWLDLVSVCDIEVHLSLAAIEDIIRDLDGSFESISWTISIHALVTGCFPFLWGAFSEVHGRKAVYLVSIALFVLGSGVAGGAQDINMLIVMRALQAIGGSALLTIGAATLADIYDAGERGSAMGLYYAAPLLGPSLGPIIGGALTSLFSWRMTFYFLAIFGGVAFLGFVFFKDTFRPERSLVYQAALKDVADTRQQNRQPVTVPSYGTGAGSLRAPAVDVHSECQPLIQDSKLRFRDMHLLRPIIEVTKQWNNICIFVASGLVYGGVTYCITYTSVKTFGGEPYNCGPLELGLVLLCFGVGNVFGSLFGGRWSDYVRNSYQVRNGGICEVEDRLNSAKVMMPILPLSLFAYGGLTERRYPLTPIAVAMFIAGFSSSWIYSSILAYIVDANSGRSSSAVPVNSFCRGLMAFVAAEIAIPLQTALGDGGLYSLLAGLMVLEGGLLLLLIAKGKSWRENTS